ncbi:uncharacterized mitochondrial protein AtMg00860-like [Benincasa hispida]|uniref:uncharacterized mitochondrial protein AtMg00860-like n=1 Tax=Benincasa hispida TaxID=102211 RepID=UPI00190118FA|nr:uncharacterized mitochondrial protein AtMg00860-like [Benincasa hispida]
MAVLREKELYANQKKFQFARERVEYLGHIISQQGVEIDPKKVRAMLEWPVPKKMKEVQGFLGLSGYYRRFVQNYGCVAATLTQILKGGTFRWTEDAQLAFEKLKTTMMMLPVLALPDFNRPFKVETDASGYGIGVVLVQQKRSITFYSHTLSLQDHTKLVYERELLVVVMVMQ